MSWLDVPLDYEPEDTGVTLICVNLACGHVDVWEPETSEDIYCPVCEEPGAQTSPEVWW